VENDLTPFFESGIIIAAGRVLSPQQGGDKYDSDYGTGDMVMFPSPGSAALDSWQRDLTDASTLILFQTAIVSSGMPSHSNRKRPR
jgi:hypothetical protein